MTDNVTPLRPPLVREFEAEMSRLGISQNRAAHQMGLSGTRLSQWRSGKYPGDIPAIEEAVAAGSTPGRSLRGAASIMPAWIRIARWA